jgi:hypothetical protein
MSHGTKLPNSRNSDLQGDQENLFEGWIPTLLVSIAVIGMFFPWWLFSSERRTNEDARMPYVNAYRLVAFDAKTGEQLFEWPAAHGPPNWQSQFLLIALRGTNAFSQVV